MFLRFMGFVVITFSVVTTYGSDFAHAQTRKGRYEERPEYRRCIQFLSISEHSSGERSSAHELCMSPQYMTIYSHRDNLVRPAFEDCTRFMGRGRNRVGEADSAAHVCSSPGLLELYRGDFERYFEQCMNQVKTGAQTFTEVPSQHCSVVANRAVVDQGQVPAWGTLNSNRMKMK